MMTDLERAVLQKLLDGDHPALKVLRAQLEKCGVASREMTGSGFFTGLEVERTSDIEPLAGLDVRFGDVEASIPGLEHGAGFVLLIRDGYLAELEAYSYEEPWPADVDGFELRLSQATRDLSKLPPG